MIHHATGIGQQFAFRKAVLLFAVLTILCLTESPNSSTAQQQQKRQEQNESGGKSNAKRREESEDDKEFQTKVKTEIALMNGLDQRRLQMIDKMVKDKKKIDIHDYHFMRRHWIVFSRSLEAAAACLALAESNGFTEFYENLGLAKEDAEKSTFFWKWLDDMENGGMCQVALRISKMIRKGEMKSLTNVEKKFIREHSAAFAPLLDPEVAVKTEKNRQLLREKDEKKEKEEAQRREVQQAQEAAARQKQQERDKVEKKAHSRLIAANNLYNRGFKKEAAKRYQEIIDKYPDTPSAQKAADTLHKIKP